MGRGLTSRAVSGDCAGKESAVINLGAAANRRAIRITAFAVGLREKKGIR